MEALKYINLEHRRSSCSNFLFKLHVDLPLLLGILVLSAMGLVILYSASNASMSVVLHQAFLLFFGLILMIFCAQIHPRYYELITPWIFILALSMLLIVLGLGVISKGAQRWIGFGAVRFQPAEIMKLALPMMLAYYLKDKLLPPKFKTIAISCVIIFIPAILVAKQPDLGTALIITGAGVAVLLVAGLDIKIVIAAALLMILSAPIFWHFIHPYQKARILTFLNPEQNPLGAGYHIIQSKIAIGSGGFLGKGFLQGTQTHLQFLPEHSTDFIFAVLGEEFGFLGCFVLLIVLVYITIRSMYISYKAQETFSRLLAGSLTMTFFLAFFVNIGMVIGVLPVVGIPLPLISYGGSSIITLMIMFGILMSIHTHRPLLPS